jgi:hypothetical protein
MQCYGNEGVFLESAWALLSLGRLYPNPADLPEIWLYTDNPDWFSRFADSGLNLHFRTINQQLISQWRGAINFVHRIKIEVLRDFCATRKGNVLYVDTDVVFTHAIERMWLNIEAGQLYMHVMESVVADGANPVTRKLNAQLHQKEYLPGLPLLYDMPMWNAGVLGFNTRHKQLLEQVLLLTDQLYTDFPKHIAEQFAFSAIFGRQGNIFAAAPYLLHYWNLKEARIVLRSFFNYYKTEPWYHLVQYSSVLQMHVLMQEKMNFYYNRSLAGKIRKQLWQPPDMDWKALSNQLSLSQP